MGVSAYADTPDRTATPSMNGTVARGWPPYGDVATSLNGIFIKEESLVRTRMMRFNPPKGEIGIREWKFSIHDVFVGKECALLFVSGNIENTMAFFTVVLKKESGIGDREFIDTKSGWFSQQTLVAHNYRRARRCGLSYFYSLIEADFSSGFSVGGLFFIREEYEIGIMIPEKPSPFKRADHYTAWVGDSSMGVKVAGDPEKVRIRGFGDHLQEIGIYESQEESTVTHSQAKNDP